MDLQVRVKGGGARAKAVPVDFDPAARQVVEFGPFDIEAMLPWPERPVDHFDSATAVMMQGVEPVVFAFDAAAVLRHVVGNGARKVLDGAEVAAGLNPRPTPSACHAVIILSADIDFLPAAEMAATVFGCPVAIAFTYPHTGYKLGDVSATPMHQVFALEVSEEELRRCMMPRTVDLPDGWRIEFDRVKRSHFGRVRATGG